MSTNSENLLNAALTLPEAERADLAALLIRSLDEGASEEVNAAWPREIERRTAEIENGEVKLIPWASVTRVDRQQYE